MPSEFKAWNPYLLGAILLGLAALAFFSDGAQGKYVWIDSGTKKFASVVLVIGGLWSIYSAKSSS